MQLKYILESINTDLCKLIQKEKNNYKKAEFSQKMKNLIPLIHEWDKCNDTVLLLKQESKFLDHFKKKFCLTPQRWRYYKNCSNA